MTPFVCNILTLFPEFFSGPLSASILARAVKAEQLEVKLINFRDEATDKHHSVDDSPYGGGAGMVLKAEPLVHALERLDATGQRAHRVLLSPQGRPFGQSRAAQLAKLDALTLICGHYEGFDERVREHFIDEEISLGDFVLTGGEPAALAILDAVVRLRPGVLGNSDSAHEESFSLDGLLEYPHYTRPYDFRGHLVPEVLRSGNHGAIAAWRREQAILRTAKSRPELLQKIRSHLTSHEIEIFEAALEANSPPLPEKD